MNKLKHYTKEIVYFIVTMTIIANLMSLYKSQDLSDAPLRLESVKLIDNQTYTIQKGKPILIHFWATWCPTCKLEASNINFLSKHFQVITIAIKSGSDYEIKKYMDEHNYTFKVVNDQTGKLASKFNISAYPTTFIYNTKTELTFSEVGYTSILGLYTRMIWARK
ncbi:redoxin domain-containing protein [Sulfurimonas sp.]|uniref:redoxin domain-containing protein n=1 Tax=Sulfurimonas sp. TaxID=2022749 RepID=UPI002608C8A8|nr:redoxin domain-containing protein [Sulfurimonas sp.]